MSEQDIRYTKVFDRRDEPPSPSADPASKWRLATRVGSPGWWKAVDEGRIEIRTLNGRITRLFESGLPSGGWLEFELDSSGERTRWTREVSGSDDDGTRSSRMRLYEVGRAVRLRYTLVPLDPPIVDAHTNTPIKGTVKQVLEIWVETRDG